MVSMKKVKKAKRARVKFANLQITNTYTGYQCPHCGVLYCNAGPEKSVTRFRCRQCDNEIIIDGWDELTYEDLMDGKFKNIIPGQAQMWKIGKGK
jgi:predicted RNA-binding Zn-ribbon protein involved in translation (DUF1610 family)